MWLHFNSTVKFKLNKSLTCHETVTLFVCLFLVFVFYYGGVGNRIPGTTMLGKFSKTELYPSLFLFLI